jgi:hypothetical protein
LGDVRVGVDRVRVLVGYFDALEIPPAPKKAVLQLHNGKHRLQLREDGDVQARTRNVQFEAIGVVALQVVAIGIVQLETVAADVELDGIVRPGEGDVTGGDFNDQLGYVLSFGRLSLPED